MFEPVARSWRPEPLHPPPATGLGGADPVDISTQYRSPSLGTLLVFPSRCPQSHQLRESLQSNLLSIRLVVALAICGVVQAEQPLGPAAVPRVRSASSPAPESVPAPSPLKEISVRTKRDGVHSRLGTARIPSTTALSDLLRGAPPVSRIQPCATGSARVRSDLPERSYGISLTPIEARMATSDDSRN